MSLLYQFFLSPANITRKVKKQLIKLYKQMKSAILKRKQQSWHRGQEIENIRHELKELKREFEEMRKAIENLKTSQPTVGRSIVPPPPPPPPPKTQLLSPIKCKESFVKKKVDSSAARPAITVEALRSVQLKKTKQRSPNKKLLKISTIAVMESEDLQIARANLVSEKANRKPFAEKTNERIDYVLNRSPVSKQIRVPLLNRNNKTKRIRTFHSNCFESGDSRALMEYLERERTGCA